MENIFDTSVLVQVVPNLKTSQNWLLDRFFPNVVTYETSNLRTSKTSARLICVNRSVVRLASELVANTPPPNVKC